MLQNATPLKKSAPGPPSISEKHVSCTAPATENSPWQILFTCPTPAIVFGNATKPSRFAHFWQGAQSLAPATRNDIWTNSKGLIFIFFFLAFQQRTNSIPKVHSQEGSKWRFWKVSIPVAFPRGFKMEILKGQHSTSIPKGEPRGIKSQRSIAVASQRWQSALTLKASVETNGIIGKETTTTEKIRTCIYI